MITARTGSALQEAIDSIARAEPDLSSRVAFVPTMGSLHEGHLELVRNAAGRGGPVVASVFVNPTQFAPGEDFESYPRNPDRDAELLESAGCNVLFLPSMEEVYPPQFATTVTADRSLTDCLCGRSRGPQHFDGVVTVVARLFGLVRPHTAHFGEKDWQQLRIVTRMAADLRPEMSIVPCPTVRERDGLAMSSRNAYLSADERATASAVPLSMVAVREAILDRGLSIQRGLELGCDLLTEAGLEVEYLEIRRSDDLAPVTAVGTDPQALESAVNPRIFLAARLGGTRLIDNAPLQPTFDDQLDKQTTAQPAGIALDATSTG